MKKFPSYYRTLFFILLLLVAPQIHEAQNVIVPAKDKGKSSPLIFNASTTNAGKALYEVNCQSCHGNPGKGNYLRGLNPPPADLGSEQAQNQTDGELFYRISEGNPIMPKFKATLSENERWELVSFIRSFN
ncbi:MAG: cytochrome c, partial [Bacteroidota bacterium]|nr:cytochrome c [Bacteroidota bacterium]